MLESWTRGVIRHRFVVIAVWVVIGIIGLIAGFNLNNHLTTSLAVPGTESAKADQILRTHFGENVEGTFTVILPFKNATEAQIKLLTARISSAAGAIPTGKVTAAKALGGVLYASVGTAFNLRDASLQTVKLRQALARQGLKKVMVTGPPALQFDLTPVLGFDLRWGASMAVLLALLFLFLVLGLSWVLIVPFLVAGAATAAALSVVFLIAQHFLMVLYIPNVIELIGLGLAIDYSLLIVHRFRREIAFTGGDLDLALVRTMATAGRTVTLSGFTAAIGLATLFLVPVPFMRSLGVAGLVVPIVSLIAALSLQPALLSVLGRRGVTSVRFHGLMGRRDFLGGAWSWIARFVISRPVLIMLSSTAVLAILAGSIFGLQRTPSSVIAVPSQLESSEALKYVNDRAGPGIITPNQIVVDLGAPHRTSDPAVIKATLELASKILKDKAVFLVAIGKKSPYVDSTGRYQRLLIIGHHEFGAAQSQRLVKELRSKYILKAGYPEGTKIYLGGAPAQGVDFLASVFGVFPFILVIALLIAYLVLVRSFRSLILPLIAVVLDLVSIAVAFGILVVIFRFGFGTHIFGTYHVAQIEGWSLIFLFAMLFGLSMDYEVFIVSRMREAWDKGVTNEAAIIEGLTDTGGVVTAAAIILVGALSGLVFGHIVGLQELGVGLAFGILIDATIVRGLLLPSIMTLLGRWNWWLPELVAQVLHTKASPLEIRETRPLQLEVNPSVTLRSEL
jgi:RND superfamily putative drug exporter